MWYDCLVCSHSQCAKDYKEAVRRLTEALAELGEFRSMVLRVEAVLNDPPVPSRMLIPVLRNALYPEENDMGWGD